MSQRQAEAEVADGVVDVFLDELGLSCSRASSCRPEEMSRPAAPPPTTSTSHALMASRLVG
jgi:hypothetical protein